MPAACRCSNTLPLSRCRRNVPHQIPRIERATGGVMSTSWLKTLRGAGWLPGVVLAAAATAAIGCGDMDPGGVVIPDCQPAAGAMLPWKTGNNWSYQVNDEGVVSVKITTI